MDDRLALGDPAPFAVDRDRDRFVQRVSDLRWQRRNDLDLPTRCLDCTAGKLG
jgi:hypothetical protein